MQITARRVFFLIALFAALPAMAGKVGFLDTDRAIKSVKEGQRQMQALDTWANERADEVERLRQRPPEIASQIDTQRRIASEEVIRGLEQDLLQARRDFEDATRALQRDFEAKQKELMAQVATRVRDLAREYAEANGFDAILPFETIPLVYVTEEVIITEAVIRLYDQRYPVD
jgi:Skp family chaperone for outer membrane proteins